MRFEVEEIEFAVRQLRDHGIIFEEYGLPGMKTVDGIVQHESGGRARDAVVASRILPTIWQYGCTVPSANPAGAARAASWSRDH